MSESELGGFIQVIEPTQNMAISDIQAARCESFTISEGGRNE